MSEFEMLVDEAKDRLRTGVAEDVEDAVFQLVDEGIAIRGYEDAALAQQLRAEGFA